MGICVSRMPANSAETYTSTPDFLSALCDLTKSSESSLISLPQRQQFVAFLLLEGTTKHQFMQKASSFSFFFLQDYELYKYCSNGVQDKRIEICVQYQT